MLTLAPLGSRGQAPEDWRTPRRFAYFRNHRVARSVLDCGGPPPLFPETYQTVPMLTGNATASSPCPSVVPTSMPELQLLAGFGQTFFPFAFTSSCLLRATRMSSQFHAETEKQPASLQL